MILSLIHVEDVLLSHRGGPSWYLTLLFLFLINISQYRLDSLLLSLIPPMIVSLRTIYFAIEELFGLLHVLELCCLICHHVDGAVAV